MRRLTLAQRRGELIAAATRVIARDGLAAASTRAIVAEAGMPLGALHYAFESRDDLLRTLMAEVAQTERDAVLAALDSSDARTVEALLSAAFDTYLTLLEAHPEEELAVLELALYGARLDPELVAEQWASYYTVAADGLRRGAELCGVTWRVEVDEVAASMISCLDGLTLTWLATRNSADARRHLTFLARSFAALAEG